jgi:hypothetical protein
MVFKNYLVIRFKSSPFTGSKIPALVLKFKKERIYTNALNDIPGTVLNHRALFPRPVILSFLNMGHKAKHFATGANNISFYFYVDF